MSSIDVDRVYSSFFISRDYFVSGFSFPFTICILRVKQDQTGLGWSARWSGQLWSRGGPMGSQGVKLTAFQGVKGWAYRVPGKVTQVVRCPCMAPPVSYHTMTMHRLHVTAHNRDAATLRVSQWSPNRQSWSPWGTRLLWGSASHLEMSILRSSLVSCNSWSCISRTDIVIPALNLNSYSRRHLEKKIKPLNSQCLLPLWAANKKFQLWFLVVDIDGP